MCNTMIDCLHCPTNSFITSAGANHVSITECTCTNNYFKVIKNTNTSDFDCKGMEFTILTQITYV